MNERRRPIGEKQTASVTSTYILTGRPTHEQTDRQRHRKKGSDRQGSGQTEKQGGLLQCCEPLHGGVVCLII